jgi:para-aminobenzoate synthetase component 2
MLLVVDNHDSFTWNLVHALMRWADDVEVVQSDAVSVAEVLRAEPRGLVLGPGPGSPEDAGVSLELAQVAGERMPVLGVCLGHQVIARAFGARIQRAARPVHGVASPMKHDGRGVFEGLPTPLAVGRYHSLVVAPETVPDVLEPCAWSATEEVMGLRHRTLPIDSVQFHPESFLTEHGDQLLRNFVTRLPRPSPASTSGVKVPAHG